MFMVEPAIMVAGAFALSAANEIAVPKAEAV